MKLIEEWRQAWRWFSMQAMFLAVTILAAWAVMPDDLKDALPKTAVAIVAGVVLICGIAGRLIDQPRAR